MCATDHPVRLHGGMCLAARSQPLLITIVTFVQQSRWNTPAERVGVRNALTHDVPCRPALRAWDEKPRFPRFRLFIDPPLKRGKRLVLTVTSEDFDTRQSDVHHFDLTDITFSECPGKMLGSRASRPNYAHELRTGWRQPRASRAFRSRYWPERMAPTRTCCTPGDGDILQNSKLRLPASCRSY